jgi:hypothetical protein
MSALLSQEFFLWNSQLNNQPSLIELVKVSELIPYREYDRMSVAKEPSNNPSSVVEELGKSIIELGLLSPLKLSFNKTTLTALLEEGNTRLAFALKNNIEYLPVKVIDYFSTMGGYIQTNQKIPEKGRKKFNSEQHFYLPSDLGFSVLQSGKHPYFSQDLITKIESNISLKHWESFTLYE